MVDALADVPPEVGRQEGGQGREPHDAVGGNAAQLRQWQFEWLLARGLRPNSRLLDLGCGTLRGGIAFISYLDSGHYVGVDPRPEFLECGNSLISQLRLCDKFPELLSLHRFDQIVAPVFDFVLTQSVVNHLDRAGIEATICRVASSMRSGAIWLTTLQLSSRAAFVEPGKPHRWRAGELTSSRVNPEWFFGLCAAAGLAVVIWPDRAHPAGLVTATLIRT